MAHTCWIIVNLYPRLNIIRVSDTIIFHIANHLSETKPIWPCSARWRTCRFSVSTENKMTSVTVNNYRYQQCGVKLVIGVNGMKDGYRSFHLLSYSSQSISYFLYLTLSLQNERTWRSTNYQITKLQKHILSPTLKNNKQTPERVYNYSRIIWFYFISALD